MSEPSNILAAQYLRMSTEHQRYSLENQASVIDEYARRHGYQIQRTYYDPGRSGLTLQGRKGLQALLSDALAPDCAFQAILVLDVSRWGRFQDADQAAYYEFLCRSAGRNVVYCGEPFDNDGSAVSTILKVLKRVMASEYSRELGEKVIRAQLHQAQLGFRQGGAMPYGFRRQLVDGCGRPKGGLAHGEIKALSTDRVMLVHGPEEELAVIRRIFRMWARQNLSAARIARRLNADGVSATYGKPWSDFRVRNVLRNELAIGNMVFNRRSRRMKSSERRNAEGDWVRIPCLPPIVSRSLWVKAQERMASRAPYRTPDQELLQNLKRVLRREGAITYRSLRQAKGLSASNLRAHFGSVRRACELIGLRSPSRWSAGPDVEATNKRLLADLRALHARHGYVSARLINADPSLPSVSLLASRFGTLTSAYRQAGLASSQPEYVRAALDRRRKATGMTSGPHRSDAQLLADLRGLGARCGYLSSRLIGADPACAAPKTYAKRFGSLLQAYQLVGFSVRRSKINQALSSVKRAQNLKKARLGRES